MTPSKTKKKSKTKSGSNLRNIKLVLEYDGRAFVGFQRQPRSSTVQRSLERALSKLFDRRTKIDSASGRTDAGVHASHQVVNVKVQSKIPPYKIRLGLNHYLPDEVAVKEVKDVPLSFHSRYSARAKEYEYRIWNHPVRSPLRRRHACHIPYALDIERMKKAAEVFKGKRDFGAFCAANSGVQSKVRTIKSLRVSKKGAEIIIRIKADGFLYHMVRNISGALIAAGNKRLTLKELRAILKSKDRRLAPSTAPAEGLSLISVTY